MSEPSWTEEDTEKTGGRGERKYEVRSNQSFPCSSPLSLSCLPLPPHLLFPPSPAPSSSLSLPTQSVPFCLHLHPSFSPQLIPFKTSFFHPCHSSFSVLQCPRASIFCVMLSPSSIYFMFSLLPPFSSSVSLPLYCGCSRLCDQSRGHVLSPDTLRRSARLHKNPSVQFLSLADKHKLAETRTHFFFFLIRKA